MHLVRHGFRLLIVVLVLSVAGCAPTSAPASPPATAAATGSTSPVGSSPLPAAAHVRLGTQPSTVGAALYIAADRGYFQQEGIEPELVPFTNASEMIPALATDQLDTASIGGNPAMWNAV